jgi:hypothetical protein
MALGCRPDGAAKAPATASRESGARARTVPADGVYYCVAVSSMFATWECLGEVSAELARRRAESIRVTVEGGRRVSEERINGHGTLQAGHDVRSVYTQEGPGQPIVEAVFDGYGVERGRVTYTPDGSRGERRNAWGELACAGSTEESTWIVALHERDAQGRRVRTRFQDASGAPRTGGLGVSEVRLGGYGAFSQPGEITRFDALGRPVDNEHGVHRERLRWSPWGVVAARFFAPDGSPARAHDRWGLDYQLDLVGNPFRTDRLDAHGAIVNGAITGGRLVFAHNAFGERIEERSFGPDGSPHEGAGGSLVRQLFDSQGRVSVTAFLDADGHPTPLGNYARRESRRDAVGAVLEERIFRADGSPGHHRLGDRLASTQYAYDERHNLVETRRFAADGRPGVDFEGASSEHRRYHHDKLIELEHRGPDGELHDVLGVARVRYHRDATGMLLGRTFENAKGEVVKAYDYHAFLVGYAGSPKKTTATRTKEEARARAQELVAAVRKTGSFFQAGAAFADNPGAQPESERGATSFWPALAEALEQTPVGAVTPVVETEAGMFVAKRLR